ncbi:hypothetical protein ACTV2B_004052 [Cronobacter turicensis]|nr:hypothetical protein [Cronobacter turicensis]
MRWGLIFCFGLCALSFALGFYAGAVDWSWMKSGHNEQVAFLAMVGGWVSGLATTAAVIVSLWMAYQASQNNVEKIDIKFFGIGDVYSGERCVMPTIVVTNLRPVVTPLMRLTIQVNSLELDLSPMQMGNARLPYTLHQQGERWFYETYFTRTHAWIDFYQMLFFSRNTDLKKGFLVVETALRQHRIKLPKKMIESLKELKRRMDDGEYS